MLFLAFSIKQTKKQTGMGFIGKHLGFYKMKIYLLGSRFLLFQVCFVFFSFPFYS